MYYCLNPDWSLCSWTGLPYGLRNEKNGHTTFLHDADCYLLLYRCNGRTDFDTLSLSDRQKQFLSGMEAQGLLLASQEPKPMDGPIPGKIYSNRYRESVHWSITGRCNYRCRHCFQSAEKGELGQPTLEQLYDIIEQFAACGIRTVSITGGEPLIRSDFFEILDALRAHDIRVSVIYTNGALVNQALIDQLLRRDMHPSFQLSFDGVGWHDWMRGVPGAEEMAIRAIRLLKENGFKVSCALALCRENAGSLLETAQLLERLGCGTLKLQRCFPQGQWRMETSHYLSNDELLTLYMQFAEQLIRAGVSMPVQMEGVYAVSRETLPAEAPEQAVSPEAASLQGPEQTDMYHIAVLCDREAEPEVFPKLPGCGVTWSAFFVGPNGAVVPCMNMCGAAVEALFPNLFETPLQKILSDSSYVQYSEVKRCQVVEHNPECRDCGYRFRCGGGQCRAMAIGDCGMDYLCLDAFTCYLFKSGWVDRLKQRAAELLEQTGNLRDSETVHHNIPEKESSI